MADGPTPVTAHKTGSLSIKMLARIKKKEKVAMAVVNTHLEGRAAKDPNSSELLTDPMHGSHWVESVSREKGPSQSRTFDTAAGEQNPEQLILLTN